MAQDYFISKDKKEGNKRATSEILINIFKGLLEEYEE